MMVPGDFNQCLHVRIANCDKDKAYLIAFASEVVADSDMQSPLKRFKT